MLRITGGILKGKKIFINTRSATRYTSAKVREALFNILGSVNDKRILDLFTGSGAFGIVALSRGAGHATCIENDPHMVATLRRNLLQSSLNNACQVLYMDVRYAIPFLFKKSYKYDIIFADPPYGKGLIVDTMKLLEENPVYHDKTIVILEYSKREDITVFNSFKLETITIKKYGDTVIRMLRA